MSSKNGARLCWALGLLMLLGTAPIHVEGKVADTGGKPCPCAQGTNSAQAEQPKSVLAASPATAPMIKPADKTVPQNKPAAMYGNATRDEVLIESFCIFAVLLVLYPILRYLIKQWNFRRDRLFGAMSGDAAVYYYLQFRQGADILRVHPPILLGEKLNNCWYDPKTHEQYLKAFERDFYRWYGRRYYIAPLSMLVLLTIFSAYWAEYMLRVWAANPGPGLTLRALVASAMAGAFVWIVSDEIDRLRRRDFTTSDVYYYVFRVLLAIPFAWALSNAKELSLETAIPIAFFLGAFPTSTLFLIARRLGSRWLKLGDDPNDAALDLEKLQSIGKSNAERFKDEGVATISTLAYADPIDLTIRTNFDFSYVVDCISQALAWIYFEDSLKKLAAYSMRGAQEISTITRWADDTTNAEGQAKAKHSIESAAGQLNMDPVALRVTLDQIALDPYTNFLVNVWD